MSNDFLIDYHIPTVHHALNTGEEQLVQSVANVQQSEPINNTALPEHSNINRVIPPGLPGTDCIPPATRPIKRKLDEDATATAPENVNGQLPIFQGRDPSYPNELNALIHPVYCELCNTHANSLSSAKDHYESKTHDRNITSWLRTNYTNKGLEAPIIKRFIKDGPTGPEAFHCKLCDLKLMSLSHANQHYAGRKHRLVANKVSQPSGSGYYNSEGNWVRTGTKYVPTMSNDGRFGIGELHKNYTPAAADTSAMKASQHIVFPNAAENALQIGPLPLYCQLCKVRVTSEFQMKMHLDGAKHRKKQNVAGVDRLMKLVATTESTNVAPKGFETIMNIINDKTDPNTDLSMYRTPSGSYYCKICNLSILHVTALQQHLRGKKHLKKACEQKET